ncbi:MAG: LemA family protein [Bacteroidia bacterium]|nr:LemA family protein [Bacteroidia bacterium]
MTSVALFTVMPGLLAVSTMLVVVPVVLILLLAPVIWLVMAYNRLARLRVRCENAYSQIDVQLKRRFDLVPNLVEAVKGYMAHERQTLEAVIRARAAAVDGLRGASGAMHGGVVGMGALAAASGQLDAALGRLFGVMERYPDLKANQNALQLQEELVHTENRIAFARQGYNDSVQSLNAQIAMFPTNLVAGLFAFRPMPMFEAADQERAAVRVNLGDAP